MFVMKQSQTYVWPVTVEFPVSGGKFNKQTFDVEFTRVSQSRMKEIMARVQKEEISDMDLCREIIAGWKGIDDGQGNDVPFSEGARDQLLDIPLVSSAVVLAFFGSFSGAKAKN